MTREEATFVVKSMQGNVPFFPHEEAAQAMIAAELVSMCATLEQGVWLARRYAQLYRHEWNFSELRALYCSKFKPADGVEVFSSVYVDGIPSEAPQQAQQRFLSPGEVRQIESGEASADPALSELVHQIAEDSKMPVLKRRTVEEIETALYGAPRRARVVEMPTRSETEAQE